MKIITGNWKMNGSVAELEIMINAMQSINTKNKVIICVPFTMLGKKSDKISIGAQDVSSHENGAYTGEVSAKMLMDANAEYVIVGHSERRQYHSETNDTVKQKAKCAIESGLIPIICIGETMEEKQAGKTMKIIESGLRESIPADVKADVIVAYEPRWAIGADLTPTIDEISKTHTFIANILENMGLTGTPILYGASVNGSNAAEIMSIPNVDGVLVGGASLKPDNFLPIIESV
ncbi:MAG: triose-phosphate isomerase [Alphaproteobacteria bacterium]|nr:triose-phosphate isomerase [Alphaproteobacteria bacterium]MBN2675079.1 triose-phosphate isomerase [Alphaproteobacteria bacterium]